MRSKKYLFNTARQLDGLIAQYFEIDAIPQHDLEAGTKEGTTGPGKQQATRQPDHPTITGLSLHLGFNSKQAFDEYELNGKFADRLKRARLRIEALYEKKLHTQYTSGAIFALKSLGWNERPENKQTVEPSNITLKVQIIQSGPQLASSENEVVL